MNISHAKRRFFSALIALVLVLAIGSMSVCAYDVSSYFTSTSFGQRLAAVSLTGHYRTDLCAVALSQVGYHETGYDYDNITEYGAYFHVNGAAWCGIFVSWCARQAGIPTSTIATSYGSSASGFGVSARDTSYTPIAGDLAFFAHGHVAIVTAVDASYIYIVHGNWSDSVVTSRVPRSTLTLSGYRISGFGTYYCPSANKLTISYNACRGTVAGSEETTTQYTVKAGTGGLNVRAGAGTANAKVTTFPEGASFTVSDTKAADGYTWGLTSYAGKAGWAVISNPNWVSTAQVRATTYYVTKDGMIHLSSNDTVHTQVLNQGVLNADGLYDDTTFRITREGYTFLGWSLTAGGSDYFDKSTPRKAEDIVPEVKNGSQSVTLYAVWEKGSYTLTYHANGGTGAPMSEERTTAKPLSGTLPTRKGYAFLGWATDPKATAASYQPGDMWDLREDTTLYAVWRDAVLTVRYNAGGGILYSETYTAGNDGTILLTATERPVTESWLYNATRAGGLADAAAFDLAKPGFAFLGWSTNPSCTNLFRDDDDTVLGQDLAPSLTNGDAEITLYAVWKRVAKNSAVVVGDVNHDSEVSATDRVLLSRYLAGDDISLDAYGLKAADINDDGEVSNTDRVYLARYLADWGYAYSMYFE